jgi:predicted nucleic acid-binding protein
LAPRAVAIAGQLDHPVYDYLYLALAEAEQADLVTADTRLVGKVRATSWEQRTVSLSEHNSASSDQ